MVAKTADLRIFVDRCSSVILVEVVVCVCVRLRVFG